MAEHPHLLHFDALDATIQAIHHNSQAIHHGFTKLLSSCADNTLLLRQILDLLPDSTSLNQPHDEPNVFDEMLQTTSDATCVFGIGENDGSELVDAVSDSHAKVFDQMPERMGAVPPATLTRRFDIPGVIYTAMNCFVSVLPYDLFDFGSISLVVDVDDPYGFRLLVMGRSSHDDYVVSAKVGLLLDMYEQLVDFPFMLQVFDKNLECWQTNDFFQTKLFDPGISKHLLEANRLIDSRLSVYFIHNDAVIVMKNAFEFNLSKAEKDMIYGIIVTQVDVSGIMGYVQQQVCSFTKFLKFFSEPLVDSLAFKVNVIAILVVENSPFLEILYMVESVDEYAIGQLHEFAGKKLIFATKEGSKLGATEDENNKLDTLNEKFEGVCQVSAMLTKPFVGIVCDEFLRTPLFSCLVRIWHIPWDSFNVKYSSGYALVETLMLAGDKVKTTQMCHYSLAFNLEDKVVLKGGVML